MPTEVAEVEARIRSLTPEDRTELLRGLIADLDGPAENHVEHAWLVEAQRRHREVLEGKVEPAPGARVFERLRTRFGG